MNDDSNSDGIPINVRFQYQNANDEQVLSDKFTVYLNIINKRFEDFEEARVNIINSCDFRTAEERCYYSMYDENKKLLMKISDDLSSYIKVPKNPKDKKEVEIEPRDLIMINCKAYAEQICDLLYKETLTYQKEKDSNAKNSNISELKRILRYLERNFEMELFAAVFIENNGISYLDKIIRFNTGYMRSYGLQSILKLLDYQNAFDYFYRKLEILSTLFNVAMTNDPESKKANVFSLDILIKIIGESEERTMHIIDVAEKYSKKTHTKLFQGIINNFKESNLDIEIKLKSLVFINIVITYCHPSILSRILIRLKDTGIFELLEKNRKQGQNTQGSHEKEFEEQIEVFFKKADETFSQPQYKVESIKKYIEDMKNHINEIEKKSNSLTEQKEYYDYIISDFVQYLDFTDCVSYQSGITAKEKSTKERFDPFLNKNVKIDNSGMVDYKLLIEDGTKKDLEDLIKKYTVVEQEHQQLEQDNKYLCGENGEVTNNQIEELEMKLKIENESNSKMQLSREDLKKKIQELEQKLISMESELSSSSSVPIAPSTSVVSSPTGVPSPPGIPPPPGVPSPPGIPSPPGVPLPPGVPSPPGVPPPPGVPSPPGVPPPPGVPSPPGVPPPPGVPSPPGVPPPPGVPRPPGVPGVPMPPGVPGVPMVPGFMAPNVPRPTKPKITLKAKLKQLQWQRVLLLPKNANNRPNLIWNDMNEIKLDIDEVVYLFGTKKKEAEITEEKKPKIETKKFLDSKRTQEVSIIRTKLPEPEIVGKALINFDQSILNSEQVDGLLKILITKEELETYKSMGEDGHWDKGEKYIVQINDIPNHQTKLNLWSLTNKCQEKLPGMTESLKYMIDACEEIKSNKHFKLILSITLGLGNILNGGSIRGQADGFALDLIKKLPGIKDNNGNSIITWICSKAHKIDPNFEGFKGKFPQLEKAAQFSLKEINQTLSDIKKIISQIEKFIKDLPEDKFKEKSEQNLKYFKEKAEKFDEDNKKNEEAYKNLVKYYGYKETDDICEKNEVFFKMLLDFFNEIDKSMPKLDVKKILSMQNRAIGKKVDQNDLMNKLMSQLKQKVQVGNNSQNKNEIKNSTKN